MKLLNCVLLAFLLSSFGCSVGKHKLEDFLKVSDRTEFGKLIGDGIQNLTLSEKNQLLWYSQKNFDDAFFSQIVGSGADGNIVVKGDYQAEPLIFWMLYKQKPESVKTLLKKSPSLSMETIDGQFWGKTVAIPFYIEILLDLPKVDSSIIHLVFDSDPSLFRRNFLDLTPYFIFLMQDTEILEDPTNSAAKTKKELFDYFTANSDLKYVSPEGTNVLHLVLMEPSDIDWDSWMKKVTSVGIDINQKSSREGIFGRTPLGFQCFTLGRVSISYAKYLERIIPLFKKYGADIKGEDANGEKIEKGLSYLTKRSSVGDIVSPELVKLKFELEKMLQD